MKIPQDMQPGFIHKTNEFGLIEIIEYRKNNDVSIRFISTGYETVSQSSNIRRGGIVDRLSPRVHGVGFIGVGEFDSKSKHAGFNIMNRWSNMIERCYKKERSKRNKSYSGCTVCDEWHNFQNFAKWIIDNCPDDGEKYHIDKDLKVEGNKIYSPEFCSMIPAFDNIQAARAKSYKVISPSGELHEIYSMRQFCIEYGLCPAHMCNVNSGKLKQHKGWTKAD